jgi:CHASE3 domain sensor protein
MKDFLNNLGIFLLGILVVCLMMIGITYHELQELEEKTNNGQKSTTNPRDIEARLEEMMRKMEKDD